MRIGGWLRRTNRRVLALLVVLGIALAVTAHHTAPAAMGGMHDEHAMAPMATCLGAIPSGVAIAAVIGTALLPRRQRPRPPRNARVDVLWVPTGPVPRARSSPLYLQHSVLRR